ncbi:MAG: MBL fold metallo-hydrolase [Candidatus Diapherotrites archaeon]
MRGIPMNVYDSHGVVLEGEEKLIIDPHRKRIIADRVIVSHAHSDHVAIGSANPFPYCMSSPTRAFISPKIPPKARTEQMPFKRHLHTPDAKISLINSGHILGSGQIVAEGNVKVCVTTDFKLQDSIVQDGAEIVPCDVLVMESTFGLERFVFPKREEVYAEMGEWINRALQHHQLPILAGYAVGKAQEITKIVNEYSNATPYVHETIFEKNEVHDAHGIHLGEYVKVDHNLKDAELLILPPSLCSPHVLHAISVSANKPVVSAKCTGWVWKESYDRTFALSDHADFAQLVHYVKEASPKQVFTHHGFDRELAQFIMRELKIPARPLGDARQLALASC